MDETTSNAPLENNNKKWIINSTVNGVNDLNSNYSKSEITSAIRKKDDKVIGDSNVTTCTPLDFSTKKRKMDEMISDGNDVCSATVSNPNIVQNEEVNGNQHINNFLSNLILANYHQYLLKTQNSGRSSASSPSHPNFATKPNASQTHTDSHASDNKLSTNGSSRKHSSNSQLNSNHFLNSNCAARDSNFNAPSPSYDFADTTGYYCANSAAASPVACDDLGRKLRGGSFPKDVKNDNYWEKRKKNNEAAKKSRDARRIKEDEINIRASILEQENLKLRIQVATLKAETEKLKRMLIDHSKPTNY